MSNWEEPDDQRKTGGKYPNYNVIRTPSGHSIMIDDTKGAESVTIEHRSGSMIQYQADGTVVMRNRKNKTEITFGDNKMLITGQYDITVNGGASMKVEGDYDMTVNGNMKTTVNGNHDTLVNGDQNVMVKGKQDIGVGKSQSTKVVENSQHVTGQKTYIGSKGGTKLEATGGNMEVKSSGTAKIESGGNMTQKAPRIDVNVDS